MKWDGIVYGSSGEYQPVLIRMDFTVGPVAVLIGVKIP